MLKNNFDIAPFSTRLMLVRMAHGLTQAELSKRTGVEKSLLSRYESGYTPTEDNIKKLETFFGEALYHPKVEEAARIIASLPKELALAA